jgi:hypothetical protein
LRELTRQAGPLIPQLVEQQKSRFLERWREAMALGEASVPPEAAQERALTEATAYAIRIDVAEELTRLAAHLDEIERLLTKGGEAGKRYKVTLRVRGVVEPMMYKDGQQVGEYFYIGGAPNNATYNIYQLTVSSPAQHFFFNRQDKVGHKIFTIDYTATLEVEGGATLTLHGNGQNGHMITNFAKLVVPEVSPAPQPFNGQFIQLNVVDVAEVK